MWNLPPCEVFGHQTETMKETYNILDQLPCFWHISLHITHCIKKSYVGIELRFIYEFLAAILSNQNTSLIHSIFWLYPQQLVRYFQLEPFMELSVQSATCYVTTPKKQTNNRREFNCLPHNTKNFFLHIKHVTFAPLAMAAHPFRNRNKGPVGNTSAVVEGQATNVIYRVDVQQEWRSIHHGKQHWKKIIYSKASLQHKIWEKTQIGQASCHIGLLTSPWQKCMQGGDRLALNVLHRLQDWLF